MERLQADLEGAQHHFGAGLGGYGAGAELLAIVGEEVAAVAIGLEHGRDLADHVGVAGARDADVPFQAADLRGVREVGRADVRGGEARLAVEWTHAQLSPTQLQFLSQLPMSITRDDRLYVHANAFDPAGYEYIQGRLEAMRSLHATECRYTFCGHMHEPMLYHLSLTGKAGEFTPAAGVTIPLLPNRQWLAIPGSCGQPRDGNPAACYAIFDSQAGHAQGQRERIESHFADAQAQLQLLVGDARQLALGKPRQQQEAGSGPRQHGHGYGDGNARGPRADAATGRRRD